MGKNRKKIGENESRAPKCKTANVAGFSAKKKHVNLPFDNRSPTRSKNRFTLNPLHPKRVHKWPLIDLRVHWWKGEVAYNATLEKKKNSFFDGWLEN